jgi:hypothetical protein
MLLRRGLSVWREARNPQGRTFFVHEASGRKSWDRPPADATVLPPAMVATVVARDAPRTVSERAYALLVDSTAAYYGLFFVFCAGLS